MIALKYSTINIPGYNFVCKNKKPTKRGGGLGVFIKEYHDFEIRKDLFDLQENNEFDGLFIEILILANLERTLLLVYYTDHLVLILKMNSVTL